MGIGEAMAAIKSGGAAARKLWGNSGARLEYRLARLSVPGKPHEWAQFVMTRARDGKLTPWICSHDDLLADDWEISK